MNNDLQIISTKINDIFQQSNFPKTINIDYLREALIAYPSNGGKRIRPAICQWFCGAVNGEQTDAWHISAAIEMFHTWTLVHDDIIDRDDKRRNQPSCHKQLSDYALQNFTKNINEAQRFGEVMAILVGDLQQSWVWNLIEQSQVNIPTKDLIRHLFANVITSQVLCGEALDIQFEFYSFKQISSKEIFAMLELKTAKLIELSAQLGVIIGLKLNTLDHPLVKSASEFAYNIGLAFQLQDDLLGIFADPKQLGKPIGSDIEKSKLTILYKKALNLSNTQQHRTLLELFEKKKLSVEELKQIKQIIIDCGAYQFIIDKINRYHKSALDSLQKFPNKKFTSLLKQLADFTIHRKF